MIIHIISIIIIIIISTNIMINYCEYYYHQYYYELLWVLLLSLWLLIICIQTMTQQTNIILSTLHRFPASFHLFLTQCIFNTHTYMLLLLIYIHIFFVLVVFFEARNTQTSFGQQRLVANYTNCQRAIRQVRAHGRHCDNGPRCWSLQAR